MRIALIITELYPGGAEKCFVNLACFLKSRGHEVAVWQLWDPPPTEKSQLVRQLDAHHIPWKSGGTTKAWHFPAASRWLKRELMEFAPNVAQAFLFHANVAAALALRGQTCRLFGGARVAQPELWRQLLQRWAARHMEKLICVSHSVAEHCRKIERIPASKICIVPNGIAPENMPSASQDWSELGVLSPARVLLYVGRLAEQKGIDDFLQGSLPKILTALPDHCLVIMGDGGLAKKLADLRLRSNHVQRIHLVGWQPNPLGWMRAAEMLVLPARYEGMPNVVLEAMSVSLPVVCFEVDGVRELLGNRAIADRQIVPAQDFQAFTNATIELAQDAELREQCGAHNRIRVEQTFQLEHQLAKYEALYSSTLRL